MKVKFWRFFSNRFAHGICLIPSIRIFKTGIVVGNYMLVVELQWLKFGCSFNMEVLK